MAKKKKVAKKKKKSKALFMPDKVEIISIRDVKPFKENPRINVHAVDSVAKSLKAFGFNVPIVIDDDGMVCAGHTRLLAAKKLGLKRVPVVRRKFTSKEFVAYNVADNKTGELAAWDYDQLKINLSDLGPDISLADIGITDEDKELIFGDPLTDFGDEELPDFDKSLSDGAFKKGEQFSAKLYFATEKEFELIKTLFCVEQNAGGKYLHAATILRGLKKAFGSLDELEEWADDERSRIIESHRKNASKKKSSKKVSNKKKAKKKKKKSQ